MIKIDSGNNQLKTNIQVKLDKSLYLIKNNCSKNIRIKSFYVYFIYLAICIPIHSMPKNSSIILWIEGIGIKNVFSSSSSFLGYTCSPMFTKPNEVYINKIKKNQVLSQYSFNQTENEVILIWNQPVNNCNCLFNDCKDIKKIDMSNFVSSQVTSMLNMFTKCSSLVSLDLSHLDTSQVIDMQNMFIYCTNLKYLNVSNFKTSKTKYMTNMFNECNSLTSLDVSNFDTSNVIQMGPMFSGCSNLKSIDLSNFKTSNVENMKGLFNECTSLTTIDLSNFETSKVGSFFRMFYGCTKLKYVNLSNFDLSLVTNMDLMFSDCNQIEFINLENAKIKSSTITMNNIFQNIKTNLVICTSDTLLISKIKEKKCFAIDCSKNWKEKRKKIIVSNNTCVDDCSLVFNTFEYDAKCYDKCSNGGYNYIEFDSANNYNINCSYSLEGLYYDKKDSIYKSCYPSCKTCNITGDEFNHYCIECKDNLFYQNNDLNYFNCYSNCSNYYYYYDKNTKRYYCTNNLECPLNYNKKLSNKKECIDSCENDLNYKFEYNNQCYIKCPDGTLNNSYQCFNKSIITFKNAINFTFDGEINQEIYYEIRNGQILIKLASTNFYKQNKNINMTTLDLGLCENTLKDFYNISYNSSLYLLIFEIEEKGMKIPKIEYEVYHIIDENNKMLLNLTLCQDQKIEISNYIDIKYTNIDKYNSSSGYYNDLCYQTTSNYNTDICLKDRRNEFIENNLTLCEENCDLIDYDYNYKKAKCSCEIKIKLPFLDEIKFDKEKLKENFVDINNIANIKLLKCYKIVFNKDNIIINYGFYLLDFILLIFLLCFFLFYCKYYKNFLEKVKKFTSNLKKSNKSESKNTSNKNKNKINFNSNQIKSNNDRYKKENLIKLNKRNKQRIERRNQRNKWNRLTNFIGNNNNKTNNLNKTNNKRGKITNNKNNNVLSFTDVELHSLPYDEALKYDKRTFCQYYTSLLKNKHAFIFSFCQNEDYNSRIIKIFSFFFSFASQLFVNALFFSESTMHQIYGDKGKFNFIYQIPQIVYSSILSSN